MVEKKTDPSCEAIYILQNLGALKTESSKLEYLTGTMERCKVVPSKKKKTRQLSGYNCFTKVQYKIEKKSAEQENRKPISFKEMIKARAWSTLEDKQKETWKNTAKQGCDNPRLWE